jgi:hypothetical protein
VIGDDQGVNHGDLAARIVAIAVTACFMLVAMAHCQPTCSQLAQVTLSGKLAGANGLPAKNYVMTLKPSQQGYIAGCNINLAINTTCATSTDGSVVGIQNPLTATVNTTSGSGSLGAGTYYTVYEWYDAAGNVTLASPETIKILSATGSLVVNPPSSGIPALAVGMDVFIGTTSGGETLQGQTTGSASFVQSAALTSGASPASSNTTLCQVTANDTIWPTGTGYNVSLVDSVGNPIPQYPMMWQLLGPSTTINLSNGLPYYHGTVFYPVPILTNPANHGTQSISGSLDLGGYFLRNVGRFGIGTSTPAWGLDVEGSGVNGAVNSASGYLFDGAAPTNHVLLGNGSYYVDSATIPYSILDGAPQIFYQTLLNGSHLSDAVTQRTYLALGSGTGLVAADVIGSGTQVTRTVLSVNATGSLSSDTEVVNAAAAGVSGNCAQWDGVGGMGDAGRPCGSAGFSSGSTAAGYYVKDPIGHIHEWGSAASTSVSVSITYPLMCSTSVVPVWSSVDIGPGATRNVAYLTASGTSGFTVQTDASSVSVNWNVDCY